jgi:hypothetical protein
VERSGRATVHRVPEVIESKTSLLPSTGLLAATLGSMAGSVLAKLAGQDERALFIGRRAVAFLIMGVHNQSVKRPGSEASPGHSSRVAESLSPHRTHLVRAIALANRPATL